jgi:hypothetical protein
VRAEREEADRREALLEQLRRSESAAADAARVHALSAASDAELRRAQRDAARVELAAARAAQADEVAAAIASTAAEAASNRELLAEAAAGLAQAKSSSSALNAKVKALEQRVEDGNARLVATAMKHRVSAEQVSVLFVPLHFTRIFLTV